MDTTNNQNNTYSIPSYRVARLKELVQYKARRAAKLGLAPMVVTEVGSYMDTVRTGKVDPVTDKPITRPVEMVVVQLMGEEPRIGGWRLVGTIVPKGNSALLWSVPGYELPENLRSTSMSTCDHCHTQRRRKMVVVLEHEDGRVLRVGRSCLQDFLGGADVQAMAEYLSVMGYWKELVTTAADPDREWGGDGGGSGVYVYDTRTVLMATERVVEAYGWVSRGQAQEQGKTATADVVWNWLVDSRENLLPDLTQVETDKLVERANLILNWVSSQVNPTGYMGNLKVVVECGDVTYREVGLVASACMVYRRAMEEEHVKKQLKPSEHIGTVGERGTYTMTLVAIRSFEARSFAYSNPVQHLYRFMEGEGNVVVWWTRTGVEDMKEGNTYRVTGTIKAHDEYKGTKQTVITRVTVEE